MRLRFVNLVVAPRPNWTKFKWELRNEYFEIPYLLRMEWTVQFRSLRGRKVASWTEMGFRKIADRTVNEVSRWQHSGAHTHSIRRWETTRSHSHSERIGHGRSVSSCARDNPQGLAFVWKEARMRWHWVLSNISFAAKISLHALASTLRFPSVQL